MPRSKIFWKIYALFVVLFIFISIPAQMGRDGVVIAFLGAMVFLFFALPVFGYAWQRKIVPFWVGKASLVICEICLPITVIMSYPLFPSVGLFLVATGVTIAVGVPWFYALFMYGFRSKHLELQGPNNSLKADVPDGPRL